MEDSISWEEAVRWYRRQPGNEVSVRANYFDLPVLPAARRFAESEEFLEMARILGPGKGRRVLDLGAGHGVTSYALAADGWQVVALEPDPSREVGYGAIEEWQRETNLPVSIIENPTVPFPLPDASMDAVVARQVLHHLPDLREGMRELARVLKPGGAILTTRDHIADDEEQLRQFLAGHPLQHLYGGENAHPLGEYLASFCEAGLELVEVWGPLENILNFYPGTEEARRREVKRLTEVKASLLQKLRLKLPSVRRRALREVTWKDRSPGRIYSILARKPRLPQPVDALHAAAAAWLPPRRRSKRTP
ncbi:MAG TPA: class I SAM-dependent methyltransferase [Chthoniobacterales bacterium]|nr:class I SAM-dependent methyltransferase [Chthoniobacterales bacterium]